MPARAGLCHDERMVKARRAPKDVTPPVYEEGMTNPTDVPTMQLEVLKKIQAELVGLRTDVNGLKAEMTEVRTELRTGFSEVRAELREGLTEVRTELREGLSDVREGLSEVRTELREGLADVRTEMHEGFTRVRTEITALRGDMEIGFTAMRMQNDRRFLDHERRLRDLEANTGK